MDHDNPPSSRKGIGRLWLMGALTALWALPETARAEEAWVAGEGADSSGEGVPPAEEKKRPELTARVAGSINASTDGTNAYVNLGGPNVKVKYSDFFVGASFFPSLRIIPDQVVPTLGFGPFLGYRWIQLVVPFYMIDDKLRPTFGLGVVF